MSVEQTSLPAFFPMLGSPQAITAIIKIIKEISVACAFCLFAGSFPSRPFFTKARPLLEDATTSTSSTPGSIESKA